MSDTPISNAAASTTMFIDGEPVVEIKICRALERKLQKAQADAATMREALLYYSDFKLYYGTDAGGVARKVLSGDAGRELLEELQRLRQLVSTIETETCENCNYQRNIYTPCKCGQFSVVGTNARLRAELKFAREEVERAKADRNKSGVEERRKYLLKIQELTDDLAKSQAQCAAMREALNSIPFPCPCCSYATMHAGICAIGSALSFDCGKDYVHRSEVEKAYREAMNHVGEVFPKIRDDLQNVVDINFASSRASEVATGELK